MSYNNNITPGSPPLLWSNVQEAFVKINENFDILVATIGDGSGLAPLAFGSLETSVSPSSDNLYQLGTSSNRWKAVYTNEYANNSSDAANGLWLGSAQVRGIGGIVDLPFGSTIDGELIIDPDKDAFKFVSVSGQDDIVADGFSSAFTVEGNGITVTTDPLTSKLIFTSTSVKTVTGGDAITVTGTQNLTVTNAGVKRLTNTTTLPSGRTQGAGINVSSSTGNVLVTNTGVLSIEAGSAALVVSTDAATGIVTITNAAPAGNAFRFAVVNGLSGSPIEANSVNGILNFVSGQGITLSQNIVTDTITVAVNPVFDLKGSVFGDDSSLLVDAVSGYIYGNVSATTLRTSESKIALGSYAGQSNQGGNTVAVGNGSGQTDQGDIAVAIGLQAGQTTQGSAGVAIGYFAGKTTQGASAVGIGYTAAQITQGEGAIAIGWSAGQTNQGAYSIALGYRAGFNNQNASSIILNASGAALNSTGAGFYVNPVRSADSAFYKPVMFNTATSELVYNPTLEFFNSTISTSDSSGITVDVRTTFNTDVTVENDLTVAERLTVKGSRVINLTELKSVVAASSSFADFQSRIAALV